MKELTKREMEVLSQISDGVPVKSIGNISTVKNQLRDIRLKLGARTTPQAVAIATRMWII
jgi:DNA-binding CsgD family transcriptional regulator